MTINNKYEIGSTVFLKHDTEQIPMGITGIVIDIGVFYYKLNNGPVEYYAYEAEISDQEDPSHKLGIKKEQIL